MSGTTQRESVSPNGSLPAKAVRTVWWDYVSILSAHVVFACATMFGLALTARLLGPEDYGAVVLFMGVVQFFFIVGTKWNFPAVLRFGRDVLVREGAAGRMVWAWLPLVVSSFVLCAFCMLLGSQAIIRIVKLPESSIGLYLGVFLLTTIVTAVVQLLQLKGNMKMAAWAPVTSKLVFAGLLVVASVWNAWPLTPRLVIWFLVVALIVQAALSLPAIGQQTFAPVKIDWRLTSMMARYSFPLWLGVIAFYVSEWVDLYFLRFFRGHGEVGVYQVSYQAFLFLAGGLAGMYTLGLPLLTTWMAEGRSDRVLRYVVRLIPQVGVLWGLCVLGLALVEGPIFSVLFGVSFAKSGALFFMLLVSSAFQPLIFLYSPLFLTHDTPGRNTVVAVLMATVNVVGDLLLVPSLGAAGAAYATAASFALGGWLCFWWGNRRLAVDRRVAFLPSVIVAVSLLVAINQPLGVRALILFMAAGGLMWWARAYQIFSPDDLIILEHVRCPRWVARFLATIYAFLSYRGQSLESVRGSEGVEHSSCQKNSHESTEVVPDSP